MHKLSLSQKIDDVADKDFVTLNENTSVGVATKVMRDKDISCILVNLAGTSSNDPLGIVTERDILYKVLAEHKGPFNTSLGEIMSSPFITIGANSSLADAISIMRNKHIRRLAVQKTKMVRLPVPAAILCCFFPFLCLLYAFPTVLIQIGCLLLAIFN